MYYCIIIIRNAIISEKIISTNYKTKSKINGLVYGMIHFLTKTKCLK